MSAAARLAGFAAVLTLIFGGAALAGGAVGPDRDAGATPAARAAQPEDHTAMPTTSSQRASAEPEAVRGLAVADDGLRLDLRTAEVELGRPSTLRFAITGRDGRPVRDFAVEHEKRMHLIVVRRDGRGFQHLHPEMAADGTWSVAITLADAGSYRVFADFSRQGRAETLAADLAVDGDADLRPLPAPAAVADTGDGYRVRLDAPSVRTGRETDLRFTVTRAGRVVHTEPYLGAGGHLVALREGDLAYLHVHPGGHDDQPAVADDDAVPFTTEFPSAGRYRLYLQFKHAGRVHTAEFTQDVAR